MFAVRGYDGRNLLVYVELRGKDRDRTRGRKGGGGRGRGVQILEFKVRATVGEERGDVEGGRPRYNREPHVHWGPLSSPSPPPSPHSDPSRVA